MLARKFSNHCSAHFRSQQCTRVRILFLKLKIFWGFRPQTPRREGNTLPTPTPKSPPNAGSPLLLLGWLWPCVIQQSADIFTSAHKSDLQIDPTELLSADRKQEAQLMLTTGSTHLSVSRGQQTWYHFGSIVTFR